MRKSPLLFAALLLAPTLAVAQRGQLESFVRRPTLRVRVVAMTISRAPFTGTIAALVGDSVVLDTADTYATQRFFFPELPRVHGVDRVTLPIIAVDSVQVSTGRNRWLGAARLAIKGALLGGLFAGTASLSQHRSPHLSDFLEGAPIGMAVGGTLNYRLLGGPLGDGVTTCTSWPRPAIPAASRSAKRAAPLTSGG